MNQAMIGYSEGTVNAPSAPIPGHLHPLGALFGGVYNLDHGERRTYIGMGAGALIGLAMGWAIGRPRGKVADVLFGPRLWPESKEDAFESDGKDTREIK